MSPVGIMTERVESIPAVRLWGSLLWKCGRLNPIFMWQQALDKFLYYYTPCDTLEESTQQFTTPQLMHMLDNHCGGEMSTDDLTKYLTDKGFKFEYTQELVFEWLFKSKK